MDDLFENRAQNTKKVFTRYNREDRLKKASEKVKQLHDPLFIQKKGLIKSLVATKGLRAVFLVIILLIILNLIFFALFRDKNIGKLYNVKIELQTFIYEQTPLANIKLFANNTENEIVNEIVKVQFTFFDKNDNKITSKILTSIYNGSELKFSARDESNNAKKVEAHILIKEKLLQLTKRINE